MINPLSKKNININLDILLRNINAADKVKKSLKPIYRMQLICSIFTILIAWRWSNLNTPNQTLIMISIAIVILGSAIVTHELGRIVEILIRRLQKIE